MGELPESFAQRDGESQALSEFVETPTSGGPVLKADLVYGLGKPLVERKIGVAPPEMAANSPLTGGTNERFLVTSGAGAGSYTVDIAAPSGYRNRVAGVTLDAQGRFTLPESALSPLESNAVRIRKDGQVGSGYSAPVSLAYDPTVTATSPNPVRALSIHWASNNLVVRWSLAQDTGKAQRLFFRSSDGLTTVLLTPTALPSSVLSYTLASQALSAPCGALYLETLEAAASPMAGLPSADAGEQGIDMNPCPGGGQDPPDPPSGPAFVNWYHHRDHLGTLRNVTDEAGYVVVGYDDYPYGARMPQSATPSVGGSTRQFTGHERDLATGLDYMGARYYGANLDRFLSPDPGDDTTLADPASWNSFLYAHGNPVKLLDADGTSAINYKANPHEKLVRAEVGWRTAFRGLQARMAADNATGRLFASIEVKDGNIRNAFNHANWACRMTVAIGAETATRFLNAHESGTIEPNDRSQMTVDLHNNAVGVGLGAELTRSGVEDANSCDGAVLDALEAGTLATLIDVENGTLPLASVPPAPTVASEEEDGADPTPPAASGGSSEPPQSPRTDGNLAIDERTGWSSGAFQGPGR